MNEITIFLMSTGISSNFLYLLLAIPIVATIVLFSKEVIGVQSFNLFITTLSVLAFISTGLVLGLIITFFILFFDYIIKYFIKDLKLHYTAKIAVVISIASLSIILSLYLAHSFLGINTKISIYSVLVLILLADSLSFTKINRGERRGNIIYIETIILTVISYLIIANDFSKMILLKYPYISIIAIIADIYIGRFSSLRVREFYRFRNVNKE